MNVPLLSIIVPIYNVEGYLEECLGSVCVVTPFSKEIFLIDDGSTDGSVAIIARFLQKFSDEVQVITQTNAGLSAARNRALNEAKGEFVVFVDSDDSIHMHALVNAVQRAKKQRLQVLVTPYYQKRNDNSTAISQSVCLVEPNLGKQLFEELLYRRCYTSAVWCYVWQRAFLNQHHLRFTSGQLHEDLLFTFKALLLAQRAGSGIEPFYIYRVQRVGAITQVAFTEKNLNGLLTALVLMDDFLQTHRDATSVVVCSHLAAIALEVVHKIALLPFAQCLAMHRSFVQHDGGRFISRYGVQGKYRWARSLYRVQPYFYLIVYRFSVFLKKK